ncbi:MAG: M23 family metallopeptidase [Spirochaetales bacterium]|nr:M23 family metallopeptidase [Spirochaetales bacterium]
MKYLLVGVFAFLALALFAFDWPVSQPVPVMTFGQKKGDSLNTGINIASSGKVVAAESGEIIFFHNQNKGLPSPLGNFMAIHHGGGVETVYGHLEGPLDVLAPTVVKRGDAIALLGTSGSTIGGNLFFAMIDINENEIVNPVQLLSPPLEDSIKPQMRNAQLLINNQWYSFGKNVLFPSGRARFYAQVFDRINNGKYDVLPYELVLHMNGIEMSRLVFNSQVLSKALLVIKNSPQDDVALYNDAGALYCGGFDLVSGNHHVYLYISDFAGNSSSYDFYIKVQ